MINIIVCLLYVLYLSLRYIHLFHFWGLKCDTLMSGNPKQYAKLGKKIKVCFYPPRLRIINFIYLIDSFPRLSFQSFTLAVNHCFIGGHG